MLPIHYTASISYCLVWLCRVLVDQQLHIIALLTMSGVLFVICIPTETAERKLCGSDAAVTPTTSNYSGKCPDDTNSAAVPIVPMITLMPPPSVLGQPKPQHSAIADSAKRNSFGSQSPLLASGDMHVANERNMVRVRKWEVRYRGLLQCMFIRFVTQFQPTPKSSTVSGHGATAKKKAVSASALRDSAGSKETLVQIELGSDEYETQTTITSVDDIAVGMPVHLGGDSLKRTKSDNALASPNDDASLVSVRLQYNLEQTPLISKISHSRTATSASRGMDTSKTLCCRPRRRNRHCTRPPPSRH